MKDTEARLLLSSLLGRLVSLPNGAMELPGGKLSPHEAEAFRFFATTDISEPTSMALKPADASSAASIGQKEASIALNRIAFSRVGPAEEELRLCLDFGTAMSKAWATGRDETATLTLVLGTNGVGDPALAVSSSVFIDDTGRIFVGDAAERNFRHFVGRGRRLYSNIKRLLSDAEVESDPFTKPLDPEIDPTKSGLSSGDLLVLYLAWLTDCSLVALGAAASLVTGELDLTPGTDLRAVARRFAIPCFEDTHNDGRGRKRAQWARGIMRDYLLRAQILADTLTGRWDTLTVRQLVPLMRELRNENVAPLEGLFAVHADVREPVAAGASRFASRLLPHDEGGLSRHALLVVDAGAGTTDFAMFQVAAGGQRPPRYALIGKSVKMSTVAGNTADEVLRPLVLQACGIDPRSGAPRSHDDFSYIRNDLDSRIREFKAILVTSGSLDVALAHNTIGRLVLADFDVAMTRHAEELRKVRDMIVSTTFTPEVRSEFANARIQEKPFEVSVLLTGGSAALPAVRALAHGSYNLEGFHITFSPVVTMPDWIASLEPNAARLVGANYPQCAVAIGGSAADLPIEITDLAKIVVAPAPGRRVLNRMQISGV